MTPPPPFRQPRPTRAFTLVELLVSMTVLTLLLIVVTQMVNGALSVTNNSTRHLTADGQARLVFDRMAADFAQIVKRRDVDYFFQKNGSYAAGSTTSQDDQMAFYSETTGYYPSPAPSPSAKSNGALVGYCLRKNTTAPTADPTYNQRQLVRLSKALVWNGASTTPPAMTYLPQTFPQVWPLAFPNGMVSTTGDMTQGTDPDYQVIGEQVFRLEICYLVRYPASSTSPNKPLVLLSDLPFSPASTATTPAGGGTATTTLPTAYNGLRDVAAVVVSLAALDDASRRLAGPVALDKAAGLLEDSGKSTQVNTASGIQVVPVDSLMPLPSTPAALWQKHLDNNDLSTVKHGPLPPVAAGQVRVYERYFYLGNAQ